MKTERKIKRIIETSCFFWKDKQVYKSLTKLTKERERRLKLIKLERKKEVILKFGAW
jgi:hypothetical protein